ncbi:NAD-dependent epimerase/dehydratase family protein [uncultured Psychrobacter sp.]|uniref:NAD-dependent epimerase/dehydratase family protein n=1 Tax=uncultured Psychrobacter sp. TaxID=259303 RepID=UPI0026331906|nr:NAD-dependent epimerase/dehydratase family protein [uncultured Psychrobacter sp.]
MINYRHPQVQEDLNQLLEQDIPWHLLRGKIVLITGATGMLASYVGFTLLYLNEQLDLNIKPVFLARSEQKLKQVYGDALSQVHCLVQDVCEPMEYEGVVDYIFHAAGAASPYYIINDPVGIINANVQGTQQVLELARNSQTENVVFASTREVYGHVAGKTSITETDMGVLDPLNPRDCYPESKRLAEALFTAYHTQYGINFNSMRIAHTYGPGMQIEGDGRVMSDFINDAVNARDIILKSTGEAERAFCYITDAVSGIFRVMLQGEATEAYNLANENDPVRIIELAHLLQQLAGNKKSVNIEVNESNNAGYTNYARTALDTTRLNALNWQPVVGLEEGLMRTLKAFDKVAL